MTDQAAGEKGAPPGRYAAPEQRALVSGLQALVRLPMDQRRADMAAGLDTAGFVTGYPGSPLAGYDVELGRQQPWLDELGIVHQPALNEELAATAVAGSQLASLQPGRRVDGVFALWYGKSPGLDRAGDAIRHGNLMGAAAKGGVLVCVGDDPQAKSSSVPSTSEPALYALGLPVLAPADPQELLDLGLHGLALSRASGLWVGLRIPASVADGLQSVQLGSGRVTPIAPETALDGRPFVHLPTAQLLGAKLIELEESLYGPRLEMARRYAAVNGLDRSTRSAPADVLGVVAAGPAYLAVRYALRRLGLDGEALESAGVRLFKVAVVHPLDGQALRRFAGGLREVVVVEDKRGFLEMLVKEALYNMAQAPVVVGKRDELGHELIAATGEVDPDALVTVLAKRLLAYRDLPAVRRAAEEAAARRRAADPPLSLVRGAYFCSGCPHNTGVKVPAGAVVGSGSGCHGLAIQMDPRQAGNVVGRFQMGGEGAMWNGMAPFVSVDHFFQNLGDGTFAHSGSQAIRASVASGVDITYKLLVNSVVAMTGGQPIAGHRPLAELTRLLLAEGVRKIIVTTDDRRQPALAELPKGVEVWERRRILEAEKALARLSGVTVLIHLQECAVERRRRDRRSPRPKARRVFINPLACDGCGDCGAKSNCLSVRPVRSESGLRTEIHQESCNLDYSCLEGDCPAMLTVEPAPRPGPRAAPVDPAELPPAPPGGREGAFTVRITGIGGTGVITTARIVAAAAELGGLSVRGLDQTGIAQKGGSVCSDLRIGPVTAAETHRLGAGECDLYLGCDLLVAAEPRHLGAAAPDRSVAVISTSAVPTGRQVADSSLPPADVDELRARVERRTLSAPSIWLDAEQLSRRRFGSDLYANTLLLGAAYQRGALPLDPSHLEEAIRRNGAAAEANVQAFRYGRLVAAEPEGPTMSSSRAAGGRTGAPRPAPPAAAELLGLVGAAPGSELGRILETTIPHLISYQDASYAGRYAETVARCRAAEEARCGLSDGPFGRAVALQLHRLMACKDEYEVARLHRSPALQAEIEECFGTGARVRYHLHPPLLRQMGLGHKLAVGPGAGVAFGVLASLRGLRESRLDPFGHTELRRAERELRDGYELLVRRLSDSLDEQSHARFVKIAQLPEEVRGYGPVKKAAISRFWSRLEDLDAGGGPLLGARCREGSPAG